MLIGWRSVRTGLMFPFLVQSGGGLQAVLHQRRVVFGNHAGIEASLETALKFNNLPPSMRSNMSSQKKNPEKIVTSCLLRAKASSFAKIRACR
jgi:hypothetical protein